MNTLPSGTVTFLFSDIEGSTKLSQQRPDAMPALLARHNQILHQAIEAHNGYVFQVVGDSFAAAFHSASDALHAALPAQQSSEILISSWIIGKSQSITYSHTTLTSSAHFNVIYGYERKSTYTTGY